MADPWVTPDYELVYRRWQTRFEALGLEAS
jgi:hypothetical protein